MKKMYGYCLIFKKIASNKSFLFIGFFVFLSIIACICFFHINRDQSHHFQDLGAPISYGMIYDNFRQNPIAAPGQDGRNKLYFALKTDTKILLLQVDPETNLQKQFNSTKGVGAWALTIGPDKKIYLGTFYDGYILSFDPQHEEKGLSVVGRPVSSETYIWQLIVGKDGRLYGGTYPHAKLISYDPVTEQMQDLGSMDEDQQYCRYLVTGDDDWIYLGIGTENATIKAYNTHTHELQRSIPERDTQPGFAYVWEGTDGSFYGRLGKERYYRLEDGKGTEIDPSVVPGAKRVMYNETFVVHNSSYRGYYALRNILTNEILIKNFTYIADEKVIDQIYEGPHGNIYGNTASPLELFSYNSSNNQYTLWGNPTNVTGTIYSGVQLNSILYVCAYPEGYLSLFNPDEPWHFGEEPDKNPYGYGPVGPGHYRPTAMIAGLDQRIYIGSVPDYGELGGSLGVFDPVNKEIVENYRNIVPSHSIFTLASDKESGLVFGGSSTRPGSGADAVTTDAHIFAYDPKTKQIVIDFIPVHGMKSIIALICYKNKVYALAGGTDERYFIVFDIKQQKIIHTMKIDQSYGSLIHKAWGVWKDGIIYGASENSIYSIDPTTYEMKKAAEAPVKITAGWAMTDSGIYFGSYGHLYRWIP